MGTWALYCPSQVLHIAQLAETSQLAAFSQWVEFRFLGDKKAPPPPSNLLDVGSQNREDNVHSLSIPRHRKHGSPAGLADPTRHQDRAVRPGFVPGRYLVRTQ